MPRNWTRTEVEALVADYLSMLAKELREEPYNKTEHRRALARFLDRRSDGSIERKHQNLSAVLIDHGFPWISGYKPLGNYQQLLAEVVADRLDADRGLAVTARAAIERPAPLVVLTGILARCEKAPDRRGDTGEKYPVSTTHQVVRETPINYLELEARNLALGTAGETFAVEFERARLRELGQEYLADRVEHVAAMGGDGLGFDIRSFEPGGSDRLIEVKTTAFGRETPFFVTRNELSVSRRNAKSYHVYRLFRFRVDPRLFILHGAIDECCLLEPVQYSARAS